MTAAAERLGTVQSAVSARIASLEAELGVTLFERLPRGVRPSAACLRLLSHAERLEALAQEAAAAARGRTHLPAGPFRLGAIEVVAATRLRGGLAAFLQRHPQIELRFRTGVTRALVAALEAGDLDAAIVSEGVRAPGLMERPVGAERLALLHAPGLAPEAERQAFAFGPGCTAANASKRCCTSGASPHESSSSARSRRSWIVRPRASASRCCRARWPSPRGWRHRRPAR